jgi:hypothetical protein
MTELEQAKILLAEAGRHLKAIEDAAEEYTIAIKQLSTLGWQQFPDIEQFYEMMDPVTNRPSPINSSDYVRWSVDPPPKYSTQIEDWQEEHRRRLEIKKRLGEKQNWRCAYCGEQGDSGQAAKGRPWHVDHIKPLSKGGLDEEVNCALACSRCNSMKRNKPVDEFMAILVDKILAGTLESEAEERKAAKEARESKQMRKLMEFKSEIEAKRGWKFSSSTAPPGKGRRQASIINP